MQEGMGLSDQDQQKLIEEVSIGEEIWGFTKGKYFHIIVFHCAATVKFDEPLKVSIQMLVFLFFND